MKKSVKSIFAAAAVALIFGGASVSYAQYGGACAPACDVPAVEACAPSCDVPTCEPTCTPACDTSCVPSCGTSYGCDTGCNPCAGFCTILDDVARVAVSPFHWVACAFTDGIYPDCGCAPRPPKTACNPCTVCGDYVGGCNDGSCGASCNGGCDSCGNADYSYYGGQGVYSNAPNFSAPKVYDVETYDASPSRGSYSYNNRSNAPTFTQTLRNVFGTQRPIDAELAALAQANATNRANMPGQSVKIEPVQTNPMPVAANNRYASRTNSVRPVAYDEAKGQRQNVRQAQLEAVRAAQAQEARVNRELQNKQNVRVVSESVRNAAPAASGKTFGTTRPVK